VIRQTDNDRGRPFAGIHCPSCGSIESHVVNSRNNEIREARRRRYECNRCQFRYTTYEVFAVEYERLQVTQIDVKKFDSVIATLRAIKVQFGGNDNGHRKD